MATLYFLYQNFSALISASCKFPSQRKGNGHVTCFEEAGFLVLEKKRSRDVNKYAPHTEGVTPHILAYFKSRPFPASRVLRGRFSCQHT